MLLHKDKEAFEDILAQTDDEHQKRIDVGMLEKDYYVTMMLRKLSESAIGFIFKGGTSLSKCYKVIDRFSEDIDLTVSQHLTQGQRREMADTIMAVGETIGLKLQNKEQIQRRRNFNRYVFEYESVFATSTVRPQIIVETFITILAFPVIQGKIDSFVGETLAKYDEDAVREFELEPFTMLVMDIRRTFVDKVFALCDYYLAGQSERYSRHIYDIYQILEHISLADIDRQLVEEVRNERLKDSRCVSVQEEHNPTKILAEIVSTSYFKTDYEKITEMLLFTRIPYEQAITAIEKIVESGIFTSRGV
ncbi:nucleotidyl transferase AbiEii/AbiGii toxin family protein [Selenomonas sp. ND2010]|uniref:nucleotidyl transferase AbiEii/AbiGii toxin family protein n=1 Tax=Selenomonas sp. ND2010 TaxID=1410618 RepID=UPI00051B9AA1|nr:nucleotidyl transferase AbiEii/AbiGii toxin family protein [Selenomonas sp. ND2010]